MLYQIYQSQEDLLGPLRRGATAWLDVFGTHPGVTRLPPARLAATWGLATMAYAVLQAATAAGFSALFHATESYRLLFGIGTIATFITGICILVARSLETEQRG